MGEVGKVYAVGAVAVDKGTFKDVAARVFDRVKEDVVHGSQEDDVVPDLRKTLDHGGYGGHDARAEDEPLLLNVPTVAAAPPIAD